LPNIQRANRLIDFQIPYNAASDIAFNWLHHASTWLFLLLSLQAEYVNHFNERFWNPGLAFYNQPLSIQKKHLSSVQPLYLFLRSDVSKGCVENENYFNFFLAGG